MVKKVYNRLMKALPIVVKVLCWILWQPIKRATSPVLKVVKVFICWFFGFLFLRDEIKRKNPIKIQFWRGITYTECWKTNRHIVDWGKEEWLQVQEEMGH